MEHPVLSIFCSNEETDQYVYHPVNAYNLLKRISTWVPKLKMIPMKIREKMKIAALSKEQIRICEGIADILEFYDSNPVDIANGIIRDEKSGKIYKARSKLNSMDTFLISNEAKDMSYYDGHIKWLHIVLQRAKEEKKHWQFISRIQ